MNICFPMFPLESPMLPIYEWLIACPERSTARVLQALLYLDGATALPSWFDQMPRKVFPGTRAKTIRLSILDPTDEPALAYLHQRLAPLSNAERLNALKASLMRRPDNGSVAQGLNLQTIQPIPQTMSPAIHVENEQKLNPIPLIETAENPASRSERKGLFKQTANAFRQTNSPQPLIHPNQTIMKSQAELNLSTRPRNVVAIDIGYGNTWR